MFCLGKVFEVKEAAKKRGWMGGVLLCVRLFRGCVREKHTACVYISSSRSLVQHVLSVRALPKSSLVKLAKGRVLFYFKKRFLFPF